MNRDRIEGQWKQFRGRLEQAWGRLTDNDDGVVAGRRAELAGRLQERYGVSRDLARSGIGGWQRGAGDRWFTRVTSSRV